MYDKVKKIFAWISVVIMSMFLVVNLILPFVLAFVFSVKWLALWAALPGMFIMLYGTFCLFEEWLED